MSTSRVKSSGVGGITQLTGDGTAGPGSGSQVFTLAAGQRIYQGTAAGTNTYTTTASPTPSAYTANDLYVITFTNGNTGAATLNANTLGAKDIQADGAALVGGEIIANETWLLKYDGTRFQLTAVSGAMRKYFAGSTSGSATYTATFAPVPSAYETGAQYSFTITTTNTGASTLNANSLGAKNVFMNGAAVSAGQLVGGVTYQAVYDGTQFQVTGAGSIPDLSLYPNIYSFEADDFVLGDLAIAANGNRKGLFSASATSGTASAVSHSTVVGTVGTGICSTGTTTSGWALINGGVSTNDAPGWLLGNGQLECTYWFKTDSTLSNGTDSYLTILGLTDNLGGLQPASGATNAILIYMIHSLNSGKFNLRTRVASVSTDTAGTTTLAINTFYVVKLVINPALTSCLVYVTTYGTPFPASPEITFTGTLPAASTGMGPQFCIQKTAGTASRNLNADRWQIVTRIAR